MTQGLPSLELEVLIRLYDFLAGIHGWRTEPAKLLFRWERTVTECEGVYDVGLDDYTNDLTVREIIKKVLQLDEDRQLVEFRRHLQKLDCRFLSSTRPVDRALLHHDLVPDDTAVNFFYYRIPRRFGDEFATDLARQGFTTAPEE